MIELIDMLSLVLRLDASDVFITVGAPVSVKINGEVRPINGEILNAKDTRAFAHSIMSEQQRREFAQTNECNFAISPRKAGRYRVNVFAQRGKVGLVMRKINLIIPSFEELGLPPILAEIAMQKRGLIVMTGGTGMGKSTTQAAMIGHRNSHSHDHIITIEDPIEFMHPHNKSIISQREVGIDTDSFAIALKNAMRQAPDVIQIGEIRDADTMQNAIVFAETGHLCIATFHASNAYQAVSRILKFYNKDRREQALMDISLSLHALVSQRLVPTIDGQGRAIALEIMINTPRISDLIMGGELHKITEAIERSTSGLGLQTFDQSLFKLYCDNKISAEDAMRNSDSANNMRIKIKLEGDQGRKAAEAAISGNTLQW